jgi:integrase
MTNSIVPASAPILDLSAIDRNPKLGPLTKIKYKRAINRMELAGVNPSNEKALIEYSDSLLSSNKGFLKAALKCITKGFVHTLKANATPANLPVTQAMLLRLEAMNDTIEVRKAAGRKVHTWLSQEQIKEMLGLCGQDLEGRRDWIVLATLVGTGLRREELVKLTFDMLKIQPTREGYRRVIEVTGKGDKTRVIPISDALAKRLDKWNETAGGGYVARSVTGGRKRKDGKIIPVRLKDSMSSVGIFNLVRHYGALIGFPSLAPHDLRRSFAKISEANVGLLQTSYLLGHASSKTTDTYLDNKINLESTASDFVPLE